MKSRNYCLELLLIGVAAGGVGSVGGLGCAEQVREAGRAASPGIVQGGLEAANEPVNRAMLRDLANAPEVKDLGEAVGAGLVEGLWAKVTGTYEASKVAGESAAQMREERSGQTGEQGSQDNAPQSQDNAPPNAPPLPGTTPPREGEIAGGNGGQAAAGRTTRPLTPPLMPSSRRTRDIAAGVGDGVEVVGRRFARVVVDDLRPAVAGVVRDSVREGMRAGLSNEVKDDAAELASYTSRSAIEESGRALRGMVRNDVGPAVRAVVDEQVKPALVQASTETLRAVMGELRQEAVREDVKQTVGESARAGSREAVAGLREGLEDWIGGGGGAEASEARRAAIAVVRETIRTVVWAVSVGGAILVVGVLWLAVMLGRWSARDRRVA